MDVVMRPGEAADLPRLVEIYNHWIEVGAATFDLERHVVEDRHTWFAQFGEKGPHRLLVAEGRQGVVGYAATTPFRAKAAYAGTVELAMYLAPEAMGAGLGRRLVAALLDELVGTAHRVVAVIAEGGEAAVGLVEALGFRFVGTLTEVGFKHGRYWDVELWERAL